MFNIRRKIYLHLLNRMMEEKEAKTLGISWAVNRPQLDTADTKNTFGRCRNRVYIYFR